MEAAELGTSEEILDCTELQFLCAQVAVQA